MKYCKRCLYPENHPLNLTFNDVGICSGCLIHEEKDSLNWNERHAQLEKILSQYRGSGQSHDCIVPVSGARDSYFIVHTLKHVFNMNPLLVSYNKHYNTQRGIRNLAYLRSLMGADYLQQTVNPVTVKKVTRETLRLKGSLYWHCLAGETVFPVQTAVRLKIPLIIWGAHQGCDQVGMFSHLDEVEMTRKYRKEHDLMGLEAEDLAIQNQSGLNLDDLTAFIYPADEKLEREGVRGIYLSNYIRWDSKVQHEQMIEQYGYETAHQQRTFDTYNDVDSFHYSGLHDAIKFIKWGYGKVTDHACREIRLRRMTREQGIEHVKKYQNIKPADLSLFTQWLNIDEAELWQWLNVKRDPSIWEQTSEHDWQLKDSILHHGNDECLEKARLGQIEKTCEFALSSAKTDIKEDKYTLIGRGWVDKRES